MSRAMHAFSNAGTDIHLTVRVNPDTQITATGYGTHTELTVSDTVGHTVVTLDFPDEDFRRLILAMADATQKKVRK